MIFAHMSKSLRETFPTRASEWALALMLFLWSVVLTLNPDLFVETQSFKPLSRLVDQQTWAILCFVVGGGRLIMLAINGAWRRTPHLRTGAAFISCVFWFQISVGLFESGTFGTGLAVYPVLLFLDAYNCIRAARDAGSSDRIYTQAARNGTDS